MERRRRKRVDLELPLEVLQVGHEKKRLIGCTRNLSSGGGVCFLSTDQLEVGDPVEYGITLSPLNPPISIVCVGHVLRCVGIDDLCAAGRLFEIVVTMDRHRFLRSNQFIDPSLTAIGFDQPSALRTEPETVLESRQRQMIARRMASF